MTVGGRAIMIINGIAIMYFVYHGNHWLAAGCFASIISIAVDEIIGAIKSK